MYARALFLILLKICCVTLPVAESFNIRPAAAVLLMLNPLLYVEQAINAIVKDPQAILCTLDEQASDDLHSTCQQLSAIVRVRANKLLTVKQSWGSSASTGASVWQGANMAAWYLEHGVGSLKGKRVIELGGGVGFTSLVANALGAKEVVVTDGNEDVLQLADQNIEINADKGAMRTARLRWATEDEEAFIVGQEPWDYILASDVTYKKSSWPDLIGCIARLSSPKTRTILSMEPRNVGEVEGVLLEAERRGLDWKEQALPVDKDKELCGMTCARLFVLSKR